jgi:hypothetical protein
MRMSSGRRPLLYATVANWPKGEHHGFWDAWWCSSQSGRLTFLAQVVDYDGTLRGISSSPPSLVVNLPGEARQQAVVFGRMPETGGWANWLGFGLHSDAQTVEGVSARAWMMTLPYWLIVLLVLLPPLLWLRVTRRGRRHSLHSPHHLSRQRLGAAIIFCALHLIAIPVTAHAISSRPATLLQGSARVWVNSSSHVYHCPGSRYYGATKRGAYMSEADARSSGNRPAHGQTCGPLQEPKESSALPFGDVRGGASEVQVWVNTTSGVYHCPGSRYYRNTKRGKLMTEREAKAAGKRPAYGKTCA